MRNTKLSLIEKEKKKGKKYLKWHKEVAFEKYISVNRRYVQEKKICYRQRTR